MRAGGLFAALIVIGTAWGLTVPLSKIVVAAGHRNFGIIFWQSVIMVAALGFWLIIRRKPLPLHRAAFLRYGFIAAVGTVLPNASFYSAQEGLPAGLIAVFLAFVPMIALPLALISGLERPEPRRFLGLLAGLVGMCMIILPDASLPEHTRLIFVGFALAMAVFYALEAVGLGRIGTAGLDPAQLLLGGSLLGGIIVLPIALLNGSWISPGLPMGASDLALIVTALIHAFAYAGYVWIVGKGGAVFAAQVSYLVTGTGVLWSMLILGERYSLWVWIALATVFVGLFLVQPRPVREKATGALAPVPGGAKITVHETPGR